MNNSKLALIPSHQEKLTKAIAWLGTRYLMHPNNHVVGIKVITKKKRKIIER